MFKIWVKYLLSNVYTAASHWLPFLVGVFLHYMRFCNFPWLAFDFWRADLSWFSPLGWFGDFGILTRGRLFPWAAFKDVYVFDVLTSQFWWVATSGSDPQIHLFNPPSGRTDKEKHYLYYKQKLHWTGMVKFHKKYIKNSG